MDTEQAQDRRREILDQWEYLARTNAPMAEMAVAWDVNTPNYEGPLESVIEAYRRAIEWSPVDRLAYMDDYFDVTGDCDDPGQTFPRLDPQEDDGDVGLDHLLAIAEADSERDLGRTLLEMYACDRAHWDRVLPLPLVEGIQDHVRRYGTLS